MNEPQSPIPNGGETTMTFWDHLDVLRSSLIRMAMAIVIEAVICAGSYLLFRFTDIGSITIILILFVLILIMNAVSYLLCNYLATKNIEDLSF